MNAGRGVKEDDRRAVYLWYRGAVEVGFYSGNLSIRPAIEDPLMPELVGISKVQGSINLLSW